MKRTALALLAVVLCLWRAPGAELTRGDRQPVLSAWSVWVGAEVLEVFKDTDTDTARLKVTHVYDGPKTMLGTTFSCGTGNPLFTNTGYGYVSPRLQVGEVGVCWFVQPPTRNPHFFQMWRKSRPEDRYHQHVELAEASGRVSALPVADRPAAWRGLVAHHTPAVAEHAVRVVAEEPDATDFLLGLTDRPGLRLSAQTVLDRELFDRLGNEWVGSPRRGQWLTGKQDEGSFPEAVWLITGAGGAYPTRPPAAVADLILTAVANRELSAASRSLAIGRISRVVRAGAPVGPVVDGMIAILRNPTAGDLRALAAQQLNDVTHPPDALSDRRAVLHPNHRKVLTALLFAEKDPKVAFGLASALAVPKR